MNYRDEIKLWGYVMRLAIVPDKASLASEKDMITVDEAIAIFQDASTGHLLVKTSWPYPCAMDDLGGPLYAIKEVLAIKR